MATRELYFDLLRRMPVFGGLNDDSLNLIVNRSSEISVPAGAYFFREGEGANSFYVLQEGTAIVERTCGQSTLELGRFKRGDCIGEMAIIDLMPRSASVRAEVDCQALELALRSLHELYKQDLEQYAIIMMNMGREVSRRLRRADDQIMLLEQKLH